MTDSHCYSVYCLIIQESLQVTLLSNIITKREKLITIKLMTNVDQTKHSHSTAVAVL